MSVEDELELVRKIIATGRKVNPLRELAVDVEICELIAERFDCETGGECSPARFVQQVLLETYHERQIEFAKKRVKWAEEAYKS